MSDGNIRIPISEDAHAKATAAKRENETWSEFVLRCTDNPPEVQELVPADEVNVSVDYAEIESRMKQLLEELQ